MFTKPIIIDKREHYFIPDDVWYGVHFKSNAHTAKNQSNLFIRVNFHIASFNVVPWLRWHISCNREAFWRHQVGNWSSALGYVGSWPNLGHLKSENGGLWMVLLISWIGHSRRDSCLENKGVGQHFLHVGVQKSDPCNVLIFTYDLWSCFVTWPEVLVMSIFYAHYTHTFELHYNKLYAGVFGRLQRMRWYFFNAHWVGFVPLCALLLKWTS